jgi:hypothetical protein
MTLCINHIQYKRHSAQRECHYAESRDLLIAILNIVTLSVIMLSVIMLNDVVPSKEKAGDIIYILDNFI